MNRLSPEDFIITRKRKKYKFAIFNNLSNCYEYDDWEGDSLANVLEMGAGTGLFSVALASRYPDKYIAAVDVKADRLQYGAQIAERKSIANLKFLRARADQLCDLFSDHSLSEIWVTFPDPFPKERSAKHRLTHDDYLETYCRLLKPDGAIYFKTDSLSLFHWSLERLCYAKWRIEEISFDLHESVLNEDYKTTTTYEKKYMLEGKRINFLKARPPL